MARLSGQRSANCAGGGLPKRQESDAETVGAPGPRHASACAMDQQRQLRLARFDFHQLPGSTQDSGTPCLPCPALPCFRARPPGSNSPSHAPNRRRTSTERHPPAQPYDDDDAAARAAAIARYPIGKAFRRDGGPPCPPFFAGFGTAAPSPLAESSRWERARATPAARRQLCACREPSETEEAVFHECALQRACLPVRLFALCDAMGHG